MYNIALDYDNCARLFRRRRHNKNCDKKKKNTRHQHWLRSLLNISIIEPFRIPLEQTRVKYSYRYWTWFFSMFVVRTRYVGEPVPLIIIIIYDTIRSVIRWEPFTHIEHASIRIRFQRSPTWLNIMIKMYSKILQNDNIIIFCIGTLAAAAYIDRWVADAPSSPGSNAYTFFVRVYF